MLLKKTLKYVRSDHIWLFREAFHVSYSSFAKTNKLPSLLLLHSDVDRVYHKSPSITCVIYKYSGSLLHYTAAPVCASGSARQFTTGGLCPRYQAAGFGPFPPSDITRTSPLAVPRRFTFCFVLPFVSFLSLALFSKMQDVLYPWVLAGCI